MKTSTSLQAIISITMILFVSMVIAQNTTDAEKKYRVTAYQKNNNRIVSVSNEVKLTPAAVLYIPNAFTPNGDGLNETFGAKGEGISEFNMQIFDRWGILIFESNDLTVQWDGYIHQDKAPMGVYVYKISAKGQSEDGDSKKLINETGKVTLVL